MNIRKQRAMEEAHLSKSTPRKPKYKDYRNDVTLDRVVRELKVVRRWGDNPVEQRSYFERHYKNGGKIYDLAIALESSPLMQALS